MQKSKGFEGELIIEIPKIAIRNCENHPLIKGLFISSMGVYPKALHHFYKRPSGISQLILIYCTHGRGWVQFEKGKIEINPGEVIIIPANTPHSYGADIENPWTIYWFHLTGTNHEELAISFMDNTNGACIKQVGFSDERNELFKKIEKTLMKGYSISNLLFANFILPNYISSFIFPENFRTNSKTPDTLKATDLAVKFMQENLSKSITLENIAQAAHLSVSFFSRKFKEETGYSPIDYYNHLRIQKACQLLHFSHLRINEVATEIGILDPFYFSRLFKQQIGVSPFKYRKSLR